MTSGVSPLPCSAIGCFTSHSPSCGQHFYYLCHFDCVPLYHIPQSGVSLRTAPLADSVFSNLCHFDQVSNANARRNLSLLIDFSSSGQTLLYASHINIACNFIPLPLLFAQKPRFCASAKALHFFRRLSRNDKGGYNIFHKIQPPRGHLCDRAAALKQLLI